MIGMKVEELGCLKKQVEREEREGEEVVCKGDVKQKHENQNSLVQIFISTHNQIEWTIQSQIRTQS